MRPWLPPIAACMVVACGAETSPVICPGAGDYEYADEIVAAPGEVSAPAAINEPQNAINGVVEGDATAGGLDVYSRGIVTAPPNNYIVLRWSDRRVLNTPGPDFVVFENPFETQGGVFMDPIVVEVSNDAERWVAFPHDYVASDETRYSRDPADWPGFAGVTPVRWQSSSCSDPFGPDSGGDRFDLDDIPDPELRKGFRFLRLTTAASLDNPDSEQTYPKDFISDGFDLDGVFVRETEIE